mgnify:CR=1 FL=1
MAIRTIDIMLVSRTVSAPNEARALPWRAKAAVLGSAVSYVLSGAGSEDYTVIYDVSRFPGLALSAFKIKHKDDGDNGATAEIIIDTVTEEIVCLLGLFDKALQKKLSEIKLTVNFNVVDNPPKIIPVWIEGWRDNGGGADATFKGYGVGHDLQEAIKELSDRAQLHIHKKDINRLMVWGCRFFDNEADARKSFG